MTSDLFIIRKNFLTTLLTLIEAVVLKMHAPKKYGNIKIRNKNQLITFCDVSLIFLKLNLFDSFKCTQFLES